MQYDDATGEFANAPGVNTSVYDFGSPDCTPFLYDDLKAVAEAVGYTPGQPFGTAASSVLQVWTPSLWIAASQASGRSRPSFSALHLHEEAGLGVIFPHQPFWCH